jgi:hypothetical protein
MDITLQMQIQSRIKTAKQHEIVAGHIRYKCKRAIGHNMALTTKDLNAKRRRAFFV